MELETVAYWVVGITLAVLLWVLFGYPHWRVWAAHQSGMADLAKARNEQQIQIAKAQSRVNAANLNKEAAIIEAEAVAAQIMAISTTLTDHPLYLKWQWIKMMEETDNHTVIYVPTETQIPVMEAMRLKDQ